MNKMKIANNLKKNKFSLFIMILITFVTQMLSLMKSSIVAGSFGTSAAMDAYNLANNIVSFAFGFVASGISTIIIPEYANKRNKKSVDTFITVVYGTMIIVVVLMLLLRVQIANLFSNRGEMFANIVANILIVLLLAQYLLSITDITIAYFQCEGRYNIPKIVSLICQICVIIALIVFDGINIMQYSIIIAAGLVFNFVFDTLIALKLGWKYKPTLLIDADSKILFKRFFPIIVSAGVYRLTLMIDTTISSFLDTGKLSVLSYSSQIASMIDTVLIGSLLIYLYPKITKEIEEKNYQNRFWKNTSALHAIVCLVSAGFLTVGYEGISLLFQRGAFTEDATKMVFWGASIYIIGQQIGSVRGLIYRYFYAIGDTKTPGINSIAVSVLNIVLSLILVYIMGFYGIIIGTVLASLISLTLIMFHFGKKVGFDEKISTILSRYFKNLFVFLITVLIVYYTKYLLPVSSNVLSIVLFGIETVVLYIVFSLLFNKKIFKNIRDL